MYQVYTQLKTKNEKLEILLHRIDFNWIFTESRKPTEIARERVHNDGSTKDNGCYPLTDGELKR